MTREHSKVKFEKGVGCEGVMQGMDPSEFWSGVNPGVVGVEDRGAGCAMTIMAGCYVSYVK